MRARTDVREGLGRGTHRPPRWPRLCLGLWLYLVLGLAAVGSPAQLQAQQMVIDTNRTTASFWVRPLWFKRVGGVFPVVEGFARRDPGNGGLYVDLSIDVRALQMSGATALTWAQGPEFFDVERHPWIRFRSLAIAAPRLRNGGVVEGELTLCGTTRPVQLELEPAACADPGIDCPVQVRGALSRSAFGMDARRLVLADTVHLALSVYLTEPRELVP